MVDVAMGAGRAMSTALVGHASRNAPGRVCVSWRCCMNVCVRGDVCAPWGRGISAWRATDRSMYDCLVYWLLPGCDRYLGTMSDDIAEDARELEAATAGYRCGHR